MDVNILGAGLTAFVLCAVSGPLVIPALAKLKFGQSIRDCGPQSHLKKSGTPTMGGLMLLLAITLATLVWVKLSPAVWIALILMLGHGVIGFIDDFIKVVLKRNLGLTARQKLLMQFLLAGTYLFYLEIQPTHDLSVAVPGTALSWDLGVGYYIFAFLLLVGTTNAVNLTDGLDGLASSVTIPVALAYAYIAYTLGQPELSAFALTLVGACGGFLLFNRHPAKIFMGDTGSLALGGGIAALALLTKTELLLVVIGGIYVLEALSVIIQVLYFKATGGKRFFRMSPIHHHFELGGWQETKVVGVFAGVSLLLAIVGVLLFTI
ncbi:MAG: phospho-N-acetylmuramoyl-pentapeptide-transferase [Acidaminococcaceae bacterium]